MRARHQLTQHTEMQTQTEMRSCGRLFDPKYVQHCIEGQERETSSCVGSVMRVTCPLALPSNHQNYKHPLISCIPV